jgi:two-component system, chemotaxis family, CheB/CheR fusion protein
LSKALIMPQRKGETETQKTAFKIVGVGASAGGVEALSEFLTGLSATPGMAFLLVLHRDPTHASLLVEILSKTTGVPVLAAQDGMALEMDHVYVVPAICTVAAIDTVLHLHRNDTPEQRRIPIDSMFKAMAVNHGQNSIGVVLSGTGSDGALGIQEIKGAGGITFAQEPDSARFGVMPSKAIETGCVDFVLAPKEIAEKILEIGKHPYLNRDGAEREEQPYTDENSLKKIFWLLRTQAQVDFSQYKRSTIQRRLERRMALRQVRDLAQYADLMRDDGNEVHALVQDLLIQVTSFFRDPEEFKGLAEIVFPRLVENRSQKESLRIWIPGCATGEEAYSVAILLTEFLVDRSLTIPIQIFGTDLSEIAVRQARAGEYVSNIEREVSSERLRRFFVKLDDHYQISQPIRDLCVFARHNVTYDPPFSRIDLICCRNVLIYFDLDLQRKVLRFFHYALKSRGFLELGPSESISLSAELFQLADTHHRIYRKQGASAALETKPIEPAGSSGAIQGERASAQTVGAPELPRVQRNIERLLARYAPPAVVVDEGLNIVHFQGETGPFLDHAPGSASFNLQKVVRTGLMMEISAAIEQARKRGAPARRERIQFEQSGAVSTANIEVVPLNLPDSAGALYALFFERVITPEAPGLAGRLARWSMEAFRTGPGGSNADKDRIQQLQRELEATREYLRNAVEEHEAALEELKSAHEEALSGNEEFQSTNEELETAKEELQSTNEELSTTNEELRHRNSQLFDINETLRMARDKFNAIYETMQEPLLVLDSELRVMEANSAFYEIFKTDRDKTENRLIYELGNGQWNIPILRHLLEEVLPNKAPVHDFEMSHAFPAIGTKTMRLNARRLTGNGHILLALQDITDISNALVTLKETDRQKDQFLAMLSHELRNPLAPIANALQIIRLQHHENPVQERAREIIVRQIGQLTHLVTDLLEISRLTGGAIPLHKDRFELKAVIDRAIETSRPLIDQHQHELSVSTPNEPLWLDADVARLEQVLTNLLTNAAKYTDRGGNIWLTAEREDDQAVIHVRDNGIGIEDTLLPNVFEIFTQSQRGLARSQGGLGIGLSVAKNLVEMHGGRIYARSEGTGKGSEFIVRLPASGPPASGPPERSSDSVSNEATQNPGDQLVRVLIVDDSEDTTETEALLFGAWNHEVRVARTGPEALQVAADYGPDVILLDIGLPGMDGYEVARRLRQDARFKDTLIIAVSGYGRESDRRLSVEAGFDDHLIKPVDLEKLNALLSEKVDLKRRTN